MRNVILVLAFFSASSNVAIAQVGFGPEVGIGLSSYRFAPMTTPVDYTAASVSPILSGKIGGIMDVPLNKHISFQAGLSLSRKGGIRSFSYYTNDSSNESVTQTLYVYYGEVPLSVVYKTGIQGTGRLIFGIGVVPSYIIGGQNKLQDTGVFNGQPLIGSGTNTSAISIGKTLTGFDMGLNLSAGYELATGLFFRAYYLMGVSDIGVGSEVDKNRMYGISAGYMFGKGRNIKKETDDLIDKGN